MAPSTVLQLREAQLWRGAKRCHDAARSADAEWCEAPSWHQAQRHQPAPKILKSMPARRARGFLVSSTSLNRILFREVDGKGKWRFGIELPSNNVGLRVGLSRFNMDNVGQQLVVA